MIKNILIYRWECMLEPLVIQNLTDMGYCCTELSDTPANDHIDSDFSQKVMQMIRQQDIQLIFSWNYVPILAMICDICKKPYVSWVYDFPLRTLMSQTILYECNHLFVFDKVYAERLRRMGCSHVYHFPLGVDVSVFERVLERETDIPVSMNGDISFVGNLYNKKHKWQDAGAASDYMEGWLSGIAEAQFRVYGWNFLYELIEEDVAKDFLERANLQFGEFYIVDPREITADLLNVKISGRERIKVMETISKKHRINLYTPSEYKGNDNIQMFGPIDYYSQMPFVFRNSRINLNITSKTIQSGIPQRVLDILACRGFCLTNYQPEIDEFFEDGVDLVMYTGMEDLANKVDWYLEHEKERAEIAEAGYQKVKECFSMREKLAEILQTVESDICPQGHDI